MTKLMNDVLAILQTDGKATNKKIAMMLGEEEETIRKTVETLEEEGVIVKYAAIVNSDVFEDESVEALIEVKVTPQKGYGFDAIAEEIASHEEVKSLYLMSGAYDLAVIICGKSLKQISRFVSEKISTYDSVISTATHFILKKYKIEGAATFEHEENKRLSIQA